MGEPPDPLRTVYRLLTDAVFELDQIRERLARIAELLLEARSRDSDAWQPPDVVRHQRFMGDDHGPD